MINIGFTLSSVENGYLVRVDGDPSQELGHYQAIYIAETLEEAKRIIGEVFTEKDLEGSTKRKCR